MNQFIYEYTSYGYQGAPNMAITAYQGVPDQNYDADFGFGAVAVASH